MAHPEAIPPLSPRKSKTSTQTPPTSMLLPGAQTQPPPRLSRSRPFQREQSLLAPSRVKAFDEAAATLRSSFSDLQEWASSRVVSSPRKQVVTSVIPPVNTEPPAPTVDIVKPQQQKKATASSPIYSSMAARSVWSAFTVCTSFGTSLTDVDTHCKTLSRAQCDAEPELVSLMESKDYDELQVRRLTSWATVGTFGTIGTNQSDKSLSVPFENGNSADLVDDDGVPIDRKILEMTITTRERRMTGRKRMVKFDYPPISKLKECPRVDPTILPDLFFSEEELDMYEDDRLSTYNADDIEIVANSSSLSEEDDGNPYQDNFPETSALSPTMDPREVLQQRAAACERDQPAPSNTTSQSSQIPVQTSSAIQHHPSSPSSSISANNNTNFGNYVSTPRMWGSNSKSKNSSKSINFSDDVLNQHQHYSATASADLSSSGAAVSVVPNSNLPSTSVQSSQAASQPQLSSHNPTSAQSRGRQQQIDYQQDSTREPRKKPRRKATPGPTRKRRTGEGGDDPERLLKSVQIFLRERSTCRHK